MSLAEVFDKASILKVKIKRLPNGHRLVGQFSDCLAELVQLDPERSWYYLHRLYDANLTQFDANEELFAELAKAARDPVRVTELIERAHNFNKSRVALKNEITAEFGDGHREEKSFDSAL